MPKQSFVCPYPGCNKAFTLKRNMLRHHKLHTEEKKHVCTHPGCDRRFHRASDLRSHLLTHNPDRKFRCTQSGCSASFTRQADLQTHVRRNHGPLTCHIKSCKRSFKTRTQLTKHLRDVHDEDPDDPSFQPDDVQAGTSSRRRAKRKYNIAQHQPLKGFVFPKVVVAKAEPADPSPRPLHKLLPAAFQQTTESSSTFTADAETESETVSMLDCMLDFDTDWSLILGTPNAKRAKLGDLDLNDDASWLSGPRSPPAKMAAPMRSESANTAESLTSPYNDYTMPVELPSTNLSLLPSTSLAATTSSSTVAHATLPSMSFATRIHAALPISSQSELRSQSLACPQQPVRLSTNHDLDECCTPSAPLCDAHASQVLLSLHEQGAASSRQQERQQQLLSTCIPPMPTTSSVLMQDLFPSTSVHSPSVHSNHADLLNASNEQCQAVQSEHSHMLGCGHPIVKHNDHFDFLLPNGQVHCEELGPASLDDLLGEIELEEINGADWSDVAAQLNVAPSSLASSSDF
eukprot:TRINITY_DN10587_c0_g1_i1.p1 TRINITY_DN10587_c0_g1~~TRINITY_DN10587_c0_g1_i1.p1  ORF type:complete len:517 (+),score=120.86 TRINITY_DN10587_c0_g1_i1:1539-3089(+)